MRCSKTKQLLASYLEGELNERQALKVKAHLKGCSQCLGELSLLKETWNLLAEYEPINPSPNFKAKFWQRVFEQEASLEKRKVFALPGFRPQVVPAFALSVLILIISLYFVNLVSTRNIQQLSLGLKDEEVSLLIELDLSQDLELIQDIETLEDFEVINSLKL